MIRLLICPGIIFFELKLPPSFQNHDSVNRKDQNRNVSSPDVQIPYKNPPKRTPEKESVRSSFSV